MDNVLISTLYEQINQGNKAEGDWKPQAYQALVDEIKSKLQIVIGTEHVRNRLRNWKTHHGNIMDIRNEQKFQWDDVNKMIKISKEDMADWLEYCEKINPDARQYQNKTMQHWEDWCVLVGPDRATGDGAEHIDESATAMEVEDTTEGGSSSAACGIKRKRDRLADAVSSFAETFKMYMEKRSLKESPNLDSGEVYAVVSKVEGIEPGLQVLQAVKRFMDNPQDFEALKKLPEDEKLTWILLCLNPN